MFVSSCTSSYQAASGATGAIIGGNVGHAIGFLSGHGHFRGENAALGSLIGMGVGAMLGVSIANQNEQRAREEAAARQRYGYPEQGAPTTSEYGSGVETPDYQIGGGAYQGSLPAPVSITDPTYMDADGDGLLSKGETIEVESYITNTSDAPLRDIVILISANNERNLRLSPSLTTTLQPGQKIRYTGRVHCEKSLRGQPVAINIMTRHEGRQYASSTLVIRTR